MIDPMIGWFGIQDMKDTDNTTNTARIFNNLWLSRYSKPKKLVINNG